MNTKKYHYLEISLLAIMIFGHCIATKAQDLPKIVYPSPEVSSLFKYQEYPMDYATGLPQISIPLYTVQSGSLQVPISISYHASGRKVYDQDGPIAVGWNLNAGGTISRTIYGSADFGTPTTGTYNFPYPFVTSNLSNLNDLVYLEKIIHYDNYDASILPWMDSEYDVFSYSVGNLSGKFIFKDENGVKTPVLLPYKPYVIDKTFTTGGLNSIKITDDKGILYQFIPGETYSASMHTATSSWILDKMISADKTDTIFFSYASKGQVRTIISQSAQLVDMWSLIDPYPVPNLTDHESTNTEEYGISRLTEIRFNQGKVVFNLVSGGDKVSNMQILNLQNQVIKTIEFKRTQCYSQSELGTAAFKLDSLVFKGNDGLKAEAYAFDYYPLVSGNGQINPRYCDYWGYYNNSGQQNMIPYYTNIFTIQPGPGGMITVGNPNANRNPNLEPMKSGVLKKIKYPTGGSTEFIYEINKCTLFGAVGTPIDGPGLRLAQMISADNNGGLPMIRTFKYGENESGYGSIDLIPDIYSMATELSTGYIDQPSFDPDGEGSFRKRTFLSGFIPELADLANRPVVYTEVTEYKGTPTNNSGKTIYKYSNSTWGAAGMPALAPLMIHKRHIYNYCYWKTPALISKADYKRIGTGVTATYQKVKEVAHSYANTTTEYVTGLHVQRNYHYPQGGYGGTTTPWYAEQYAINSGWGNPFLPFPTQIYTFSDYRIEAGYRNITATSETTYPEVGSPISTVVDYTYNSKQLQSTVSKTESDGSITKIETKYPSDIAGNAVLTQMVGLNMLDFPVETIETKNTTIGVKSQRTNFFNWGSTNPMIAPQTVEIKHGANAYETRMRFHSYDATGNAVVVSKEDDIQKVYIWGYNSTHPVAEVSGISLASATSVLNMSIIQNPASDAALRTELNKIRQSFPTAMVTTYTFKPMVGVTSVTDVSGLTIFYEHDPFGRLKLVKDKDGNIIKTFKYQYQGTTAN